MANIVLLSDGTGNSAAKFHKTNVWRTYQALDLRPGSGQAAWYDDGVGTSSFKPKEILGGALGLGLRRNVQELYEFLCRNYREGDRIFAFGFSRGAYTIRVLAGMVAAQGIVDTRGMPPDEVDRQIRRVYAADRKDYRRRWEFWSAKNVAAEGRLRAPIAFLGLWDTVAAYGMPIDELKHGIDDWLVKLSFPDQDLSPVVERACHALALDDERRTFHPVLWNERFDKENLPAERQGRLKQVWFTGMHANVGGGYPKDGLAYVSLLWMLREAQAAGLRLHPASLDEFERLADMHGEMADARAGLAAYYRYDPRRVSALCNDELNGVHVALPKIHHSVLDRIRAQQVEYLPHVLPAAYEVVDPRGAVVASTAYESAAQAQARAAELESAFDLVWWRRICYFITLGFTLALLVFPWLAGLRQTGGCLGGECIVEPAFDALATFVPEFMDEWIEAYRRNMATFLVLAGLLLASFGFGKWLQGRITRRAAGAWAHVTGARPWTAKRGPLSWIARFLRTWPVSVWIYRRMARDVLPFVAVAFFAATVLFGGLRLLHDALEAAGRVCDASPSLRAAPAGEEVPGNAFATNQVCSPTGIKIEEGFVYTLRLTVPAGDPWKDASIPTTPLGFGSFESGTPVHAFAVGGRRAWFAPWFSPVVRIGRHGHDRRSVPFFHIGEDKDKGAIYQSEDFYARNSGELFLYVNDWVLPVPASWNVFYSNNHGTAKVTVTRQ